MEARTLEHSIRSLNPIRNIVSFQIKMSRTGNPNPLRTHQNTQKKPSKTQHLSE